MGTTKCQLNEGEYELVGQHRARGYEPVGIDLAARVFQVCFIGKRGGVISRQLNRDEFLKFVKEPPFDRPLLAGFEACGACNYWARTFREYGHEVRIMAPKTIKAFVGQDKTDRIDSFGIFRCTLSVSVKTVGYRGEEDQALMSLLSAREMLSKQLTQAQNAHRALLFEQGTVCPEGLKAIVAADTALIGELERRQAPGLESLKLASSLMRADEETLSAALSDINAHLERYAKSNAQCQRLMTIPGIGALSAVTLYAVMGNADDFPSGRHFAAFAGFAPKVTGTGGQTHTGALRKTGNRLLKRTLYMCAVARLSKNRRVEKDLDTRLSKLADDPNFSNKKLVCALANRMARVAWTLCKHEVNYDPKKCQLLS